MNHAVWDENGALVAMFVNERDAQDKCIELGGFRMVAPEGEIPVNQLPKEIVDRYNNPLGVYLEAADLVET